MQNYNVHPSALSGSISAPPSKSHTLRAILFAALAEGKSIIYDYLPSPDAVAMINACCLLGAEIIADNTSLIINGVNGKPKTPANIIDAGNSGQVLRFVAAVAALTENYTVLTGDHSVRYNRPIKPLLAALTQLAVFCATTKGDEYAPIIIKGPLQAGVARLNGADSQPVSGLLIAAAFIKGKTEIQVDDPGEKPWLGLTLNWFDRLGIRYENYNFEKYIMHGDASYAGFEYRVPGDFSSIAYPVVAALITHSEICINNVDMGDAQGDKEVIAVLQKMGANIVIDRQHKTLVVKRGAQLTGLTININNFIDAVTILAVVACFAQGTTTLSGAAIARKKESDRLTSITTELQKMGADIVETTDGLIIKTSRLKGAQVQSYHDHRMVMSLAVAALAAQGPTVIEDVACVTKSYPDFLLHMQQLGANLALAS
jgi:3-phosphoshikimate 1-carboxyvinyltransferase